MKIAFGPQSLCIIVVMATLSACSPPQKQTLALCRDSAVSQSRGHSLESSDIGELTEACMLTRGYALKENGPHCTDDLTTAMNPKCYYRDNVFGRIQSQFSQD